LSEAGGLQNIELFVGGQARGSRSVIATSLLGSAPWSPEALIVEVMAKSVTVPSRFTFPVKLRSPSVVG